MTTTDTDLEPEATLIKQGWPPALAKATIDPFTYAAGLRSGWIVIFTEAERLACGWVALKGITSRHTPPSNDWLTVPFSFDRNLEVRLSDIMWVADAPWGS